MGQGDIFSVPWQSVIFGSLSTFNPCSFAAAKYIRVPLMCYPLGHRRHFCHNRFSHPSSHSLSSSGVIPRVSGKVAISTCPQLPFFFFFITPITFHSNFTSGPSLSFFICFFAALSCLPASPLCRALVFIQRFEGLPLQGKEVMWLRAPLVARKLS